MTARLLGERGLFRRPRAVASEELLTRAGLVHRQQGDVDRRQQIAAFRSHCYGARAELVARAAFGFGPFGFWMVVDGLTDHAQVLHLFALAEQRALVEQYRVHLALLQRHEGLPEGVKMEPSAALAVRGEPVGVDGIVGAERGADFAV